MIGEAQNDLGKAAFAMGGKQQLQRHPSKIREFLEDPNENNVNTRMPLSL
jgi:hypothetical protein